MIDTRNWKKTVRNFLIMLVIAGLISSTIPSILAWDVSTTPGTKNTVPGGTVTFTIHVTGTIPGNPNVHLLVSPPVVGITSFFTINNVPAPFTSQMIIDVDPSQAPGSYEIPVWANPDGELFPGPANRAVSTYVIVGSGFDYSLIMSPPSLTVKQGEPASFQILITYSDPSYSGTTINIQITGLGPGMNAQVIPGPNRINIITSPVTPPGTYTITVTGTAMGVIRQAIAVLVVTTAEPPPPLFDFAIETTRSSQSVKSGESAIFTINVRLVSGEAQAVTLSLSGLPADATYTLNPQSENPSFSSTLEIFTKSTTPTGTYQMTISGEGGGITHSMTVELEVEKAKSVSSISISVNPSSINMGQLVSVSGVVSPAVASTIELVYLRPDGLELTRHITTSATGAFSDSFNPDAVGAWSVIARWTGNADLEGSESNPATFNVDTSKSLWNQIPGGIITILVIVLIGLIAIFALAIFGRRKNQK